METGGNTGYWCHHGTGNSSETNKNEDPHKTRHARQPLTAVHVQHDVLVHDVVRIDGQHRLVAGRRLEHGARVRDLQPSTHDRDTILSDPHAA